MGRSCDVCGIRTPTIMSLDPIVFRHPKCGGPELRGGSHQRQSVAEELTSDEENEVSEPSSDESEANVSKYDSELFLRHGGTLPTRVERFVGHLVEHYNIQNVALLRSFLWMFSLLITFQPPEIVSAAVLSEMKQFHQPLSDEHQKILGGGCVDTYLDMGWRSRSKQGACLFRDLFGKIVPVQVCLLAAWFLADCTCRYPGNRNALDSALLTQSDDHVRAVFMGGLTPSNADDIVAFLEKAFIRDWNMRTSCASYFDRNDGRKLTYSCQLPTHSPDDKRLDHMLVALHSWARVAPYVASVLFSLVEIITRAADLDVAAENNWKTKEDTMTEKLMHYILQLDLLGRPGADISIPVVERAGCYAAKFMLDDCFWLLMCICCQVARRKCPRTVVSIQPRCQCRCCLRILRLRKKFMFMGPAFRDLLVALKQPATGCRAALVRSSLVLAREMLHDVNCLFEASLDLYALQFIPCIWGKVLRYERRLVVAVCSGGHEVHRVSKAIYKSSRRRDRDRLMFLESKAMGEFHLGVERLRLKDQVLEVSPLTLRKAVDVVSWGMMPDSRKVLALLASSAHASTTEDFVAAPLHADRDNCVRAAKHRQLPSNNDAYCVDIDNTRRISILCVWESQKIFQALQERLAKDSC